MGHNILFTRVRLFHIGLTDSANCPLCNSEQQTLEHMFWECQQIQHFWMLFKNWWKNNYNQDVLLSKTIILYGDIFDFKDKQSLNFILLVAKWYIYRAFLDEQALMFDNFQCLLRNKLEVIQVAKTQKIIYK